jgi:glutaconate CoA-transferase subunit B
MSKPEIFTEAEASVCIAARFIEEDKTYWVGGSGLSRFAILLAMKLYTPKLVHITEDGCIGPQPMVPLEAFMGLATARADYRGLGWSYTNTICAHASVGAVDYGMISALQIDPYGNFNTSFLGGDYYHPSRRFGGAGGANEIASLVWRTVVMTELDKRKFVKKPDFITSPGYLDGSPHAREKAGLPADTGPYRVFTPGAVFGYDEKTHYMKLLAIAQWVTVDDVLENMDFEPIVPDNIEKLEPPREDELAVLRTHLDPSGRVIGEGKWIDLSTVPRKQK